MGRIEQHWDGVTVFVAEFVSSTKDGSRRLNRKTLVFKSSVSKEEVYLFIPTYLNNVEEVLYVDEIADGLYLKE